MKQTGPELAVQQAARLDVVLKVGAVTETVEEFKVKTNIFIAKYGRTAGGVFNIATRGGTNNSHFTTYKFFRNDKWNANDFFANRSGTIRAPIRVNEFGGTLAGH